MAGLVEPATCGQAEAGSGAEEGGPSSTKPHWGMPWKGWLPLPAHPSLRLPFQTLCTCLPGELATMRPPTHRLGTSPTTLPQPDWERNWALYMAGTEPTCMKAVRPREKNLPVQGGLSALYEPPAWAGWAGGRVAGSFPVRWHAQAL